MKDPQLAFPLHWPAGRPRTKHYTRNRNQKWRGLTVAAACGKIEDEVRRLRGVNFIVSSNLALRIDGLPRSGQPQPADPGVAVYFKRFSVKAGDQQLVFACDKYTLVEENMRAISMHLDALRGQERWGVGTLDQAFAGYAALPSPEPEPWWKVLGAAATITTMDGLEGHFRKAAKKVHPDVGGSDEAFCAVRRAYEAGLAFLGGTA